MSRLLNAPRRLQDMRLRPTLGDLMTSPVFYNIVDVEKLQAFDWGNDHQKVLADCISEGVYRHALVQLELGIQIETFPLSLEFVSGAARARITFAEGAGRNAGEVVFERESGGQPKTFRPGRWLMRFREIQDEEDLAMEDALQPQSSAAADQKFGTIDDSDLFPKKRVGFRGRLDRR